jgi:cytochrome c553
VTRRLGARAPARPSPPLLPLAALAVLALAAPALAAAPPERLAACLGCHGPDGQSRTPETPSIGGQPPFFVMAQLFLFREGRRANQPMSEAARPLGNADLRALAEAVAALPPPSPPPGAPDAARFARGQALARRRHCVVCHHPDFSGREQTPRLANQREDYLLKAMAEFRSGARIGYGGTMTQELLGLGDADLADLAHYLAHLPGPGR